MGLAKIDALVNEIKRSEKIDVSNWGEFRIGDLFDIHPTKNYGLTNKELFKTNGKTPVIVNSSLNNGVGGFVDLEPTEKGNIITFSDTTNADSIFYQENDFIGYSHVQGVYPLQPQKWSKQSLLYFVAMFRNVTAGRFDYAIKFNRKIALELKVKLPVLKNGKIDFQYMEKYINDIYIYISSLNLDKLTALEQEVKLSQTVNTSSWKEFKLKDVFDYIRGKRYKKADHIKGDLPYISSSAFNNGIDGYVALIDGLKSYKNCITMANSGSVGSCFYHEYEFVPSDHVHIMWLEERELSREIALFMIAILERNKSKFHFNKEISNSTIDEVELILPVDENDNPDWKYMEDYINTIMTVHSL